MFSGPEITYISVTSSLRRVGAFLHWHLQIRIVSSSPLYSLCGRTETDAIADRNPGESHAIMRKCPMIGTDKG